MYQENITFNMLVCLLCLKTSRHNMMLVQFIISMLFSNTVYTDDWSYGGRSGPSYWYKEFPDCGKKRQSPINIKSNLAEEADHLGQFDFGDYFEEEIINNMTVWNNGWTVTVQVDSNIKIQGGGLEGTYSLRHFHLHWGFQNARGSEHSLNGISYPMEVHIVHRKKKTKDKYEALMDPNGFAVFGVFVKIGKKHEQFEDLLIHLLGLEIGESLPITPFPLVNLLPNDTETYFRYEGSLTTPPCSESVIWTVFQTPIEVSQAQLDRIRELSASANITQNCRPIQSLNGRKIFVRRKKELIRPPIMEENKIRLSGARSQFLRLPYGLIIVSLLLAIQMTCIS